ncbi:MAG: AIR carboxylase family protein, partial [Bryobacteraceae bacterium]
MDEKPLVGVIMGSKSDWDTMRHASETLEQFGVLHDTRIVSAHRTPQLLAEYSTGAAERGLEVIIAGAGGAAHLPGMAAAYTTQREQFGRPIGSFQAVQQRLADAFIDVEAIRWTTWHAA